MSDKKSDTGVPEPEAPLEAPFNRLISPFQEFLADQTASSLLLILATVVALGLASSSLHETYHHLVHVPAGFHLGDWSVELSLKHWVNDGLMVVFFFLLGLEIKRELLAGELSDRRRMTLVGLAAAGGMIAPALIYAGLNAGEETLRGWAVPVATDAAFALGALAMLGRRIPSGVVAFLAAFAIIDDLGAVLVIALFYTEGIDLQALAWGGAALLGLIGLNLLGVRNPWAYLAGAVVLWIAVWHSGVHATVAGVLAALTVPARPGQKGTTFVARAEKRLSALRHAHRKKGEDLLGDGIQHGIVEEVEKIARDTAVPLRRWESSLSRPVALLVVPAFALLNAGVAVSFTSLGEALTSPAALGIVLGLLLGKSLGISLACYLGLKTGLGEAPEGVGFTHLVGLSVLAGMGFTMSLFVAQLAFGTAGPTLELAKLAILIGSLVCALGGCAVLWWAGNDQAEHH